MADWIKGLGYYVPPELRNLGASAKALGNVLRPNPIINNPNVANLLRAPSVAGVGKVLSDAAITAAEVIPGGGIVTAPIKAAIKAAGTKIPKNLPMLNAYKDFINTTFSKPIKNISIEEHLIDSLSNQLGHTSRNQTLRVIKEMKDAGLFKKSASKNYDDYLMGRSAKTNRGLIALTSSPVEKIAVENSANCNCSIRYSCDTCANLRLSSVSR